MKACKVFLFFFLIVCVQPANAYIDPASGSLFFSIVLCLVSAFVFFFNSIVLKIKRCFFLDKKLLKSKHSFVIYSEGNQYYSVFKPILDEFEKRKIKVVYYTSNENDLILKESFEYIKSEFIGKGNKAYFRLAFLNADICLMTTPQLDVLQLRRSKYVKHYSHILHSIGFSMDYRLFALDYYDSVLCDANFQIPLIREIEEKRKLPQKHLEVVGSTYLDFNQIHIKKEEKEGFTVLIAPSWGQFNLLNKYVDKILYQLNQTDWKIIIRPHPQSLIVEKDLIKKIEKKYEDNKNITWDFSSNNLKSLSSADILISDFSCIVLDYAFLFKKTFLYLDMKVDFEALDCSDLADKIPLRNKIVDKIGKKIDESNIENIKEIIENIIKDEKIKENINEISDFIWENKGLASKNVVDFLIKKQKEVSEL